MTDIINPNDVRWAAMDYLSRREHLCAELETKLLKRFQGPEVNAEALAALVTATVADLSRENLQCDQRYCDAYVHMRSNRGYGPQRIRQELRQKGAATAQILQAMDACETDWFELARLTRHKKFGPELPADIKEKSKQKSGQTEWK